MLTCVVTVNGMLLLLLSVSGDDFVGLVSGLAVFDEVLTDRVISTLARHNSSTCQRAVGTLLSWPDVRSRAADIDHVTVIGGSRCLRPGKQHVVTG